MPGTASETAMRQGPLPVKAATVNNCQWEVSAPNIISGKGYE